MTMKSLRFLGSLAILALPVPPAQAESLTVYLSPNDIQSAEDSGILGISPEQIFTEDFGSMETGALGSYHSSAIGVQYTTAGGTQILDNDQNGGDNLGLYLGVNSGSRTTLTLDTPAQYFGLYLTAGDAFNGIDLYNGDTLLLAFTTAKLLSLLPRDGVSMVTAMNGSQYYTDNYYGQPGSGSNAGDPYAYLHFVMSGEDTFDRIVLHQANNGMSFESDNHSILAGRPDIPDSLVAVPLPEPSSMAFLGFALLGLRRKRAGAGC
jgi:hypothetical protein